ncbi:hypothetical protein ACW4TU_32000 [Streptomyces sp. QTS52]
MERDPQLAGRTAELFGDHPGVEVVEGDWRRIAEQAPYDLLVLDGGGQGKAPGDPPADVHSLLAPGDRLPATARWRPGQGPAVQTPGEPLGTTTSSKLATWTPNIPALAASATVVDVSSDS